ncbi:uncharacterized protein LY89DRAFT_713695 [Mollisia scopiformis]|uniref:Uncharacterized protein n=1 Tax=Mollisia scopiformis TaxID=149040 RepID=A0A194XTZ4_MOLSC|nr:uncharacterized protein LY89DRAFT_713695 [Mollisia scopiformis]KUJ23177.1 hypothetical protein LY89DRAFT_713695 [Mollisia scopiformis]
MRAEEQKSKGIWQEPLVEARNLRMERLKKNTREEMAAYASTSGEGDVKGKGGQIDLVGEMSPNDKKVLDEAEERLRQETANETPEGRQKRVARLRAENARKREKLKTEILQKNTESVRRS